MKSSANEYVYKDEASYVKAAEEMGLTAEEAARAEKKLGRRPNHVELGMISAMWSEHCSYKSSRALLGQFPTKGPTVLQGPGENAGVVDLGEGLALCFKIESHNHPSFIEPYQGAATGVGGILRDVFTMGARPIAFMNSLRFGDITKASNAARMKYLVHGVVKGVGGYGNCVGIPTVGGEVVFDPTYQGNILVNAFCAGLLEKDKIFLASATGVGNLVVYLGSKTGRDGIHGATMASDSFDEAALERRPTVQVGDPFTGKSLMEATLEMMEKRLVVGIQDMGAAGLTCSICEMSDKGGNGMEIELSKVPCREEGMNPYEMLLSESQERMLLVCTPDKQAAIVEVAERWGVDTAVIGKVVNGKNIKLYFHGELVVDLPPELLSADAPVYHREIKAPTQPRSIALSTEGYESKLDGNNLLLGLLRSANLGSRRWVYQQYDQHIGTNMIARTGGDAAVLRVKGKHFNLAMCTDGNGFYCAADPYKGGMIVIAEAARNLACVGAEPLAVTNCLNFGNPERPETMWQLDQVIKGMTKACNQFAIPVISGNVSLYNQHDEEDIPPTPVISMCGKITDGAKINCGARFTKSGASIYLLGNTKPQKQLNGELHRLLLGEKIDAQGHRLWPTAPEIDLEVEHRLHRVVRQLIREGVILQAHDCADGGLGVALSECCFTEQLLGCDVTLPNGWNKYDLFTEEQSRIIVSCDPGLETRLQILAKEAQCDYLKLGKTTEGGPQAQLAINAAGGALVKQPVVELQKAWTEFFGHLKE